MMNLVEVYGRGGIWGGSSRMQIYRGKKKALEILEGNHAKSYGKLAQYAVEIRKANPGRLVKLELERIPPNLNLTNIQKEGCRPFIGLDGFHLKGSFGEVCWMKWALGGNNGLYPLDYGVVESEGKEDSWSFFLYCAHSIIDGPQRELISEIDAAIEKVMPEATRRRCCRHPLSNFKKKFQVKKLGDSRTYKVRNFTLAMDEIKQESPEAYAWLVKVPIAEWARHTFDPKIEHVVAKCGRSVESLESMQRPKTAQHPKERKRLGVEKVGRGMMSLILELVALEGPAPCWQGAWTVDCGLAILATRKSCQDHEEQWGASSTRNWGEEDHQSTQLAQ
ncbi:hypothetical protein Acr_11g0017450 [Actinidia rufa]|uniref:Uncharacterized protein n=1 Tax=Actinidia rufa TaxID=165716 RepID=A0A7J0FGY7_9ERIC|nr:hypothetical protein Acr_11g0017450 [Actinidia rufa]